MQSVVLVLIPQPHVVMVGMCVGVGVYQGYGCEINPSDLKSQSCKLACSVASNSLQPRHSINDIALLSV